MFRGGDLGFNHEPAKLNTGWVSDDRLLGSRFQLGEAGHRGCVFEGCVLSLLPSASLHNMVKHSALPSTPTTMFCPTHSAETKEASD